MNDLPQTSFCLRMRAPDCLEVQFSRRIRAENDQIVRDALSQITAMRSQGQLSGGDLLKVNGPASLPVSYTIAGNLFPDYSAIAVFDPKMGDGRGLEHYVVALSRNPKYQVGDVITSDLPPTQQKRRMKLALCGPPRSGKSCLRKGLSEAILRLPFTPYPYVITANPDGEGAFFSDAVKTNPESARQYKDFYKGDFTMEFAEQAAKWVHECSSVLSIIDLGGKITSENAQILQGATHAVIISSDEALIQEWHAFCDRLNLTIIAKFHSDLQATENILWQESPILTGRLHRLERGRSIQQYPLIQKLAENISRYFTT